MGDAIRFLSVCSGIEAASVAFNPLGWQAAGFAEIDRAASEVLAHHYGSNMPGEPLSQNGVPNFGDFTAIDTARLGRVDVLCGGTPCQAFSVAGGRSSLADARGNLSLAFTVLAHELARSNGLRNAMWENVPGVLSLDDNAFGCILAGLVGADQPLLPGVMPAGKRGNAVWRWSKLAGRLVPSWPRAGMADGPRGRLAWRVLDAQFFGVAQRRGRVFIVADFGNGADPATVLFERQGLRGNSAPRREAGQRPAPTFSARTEGGGGLGTDFDCDGGLVYVPPIVPVEMQVTPTLRAGAANGSAGHGQRSGDSRDELIVPVAYDLRGREGGAQFEGPHDTANIRAASGGSSRSYVAQQWAVRRLTPTECERLQGFPDGYTAIPKANGKVQADGPRYKQLGNSWAVPVARWIGARIDVQLRLKASASAPR